MKKADAIALAILGALVTVAFSDVLFAGASFYMRDVARYYYPTKRLLHDIVRAGEFPLWNPYYSGGQPAAANPQYYVFYPGQWLIFIRDFFLGFRLHIVLHLYIAAFGMYVLMRTIGARAEAAAATACAFVFGGIVLSLLNLLALLYPIAWLPLTLTFVWRRQYAVAAIFFGLQALAFEPSVLIDSAVLIAAAAAWRRDWKALLVVPAGALIGSAQLLPMFDLVRSTPRAGGLTFDAVSFWSMPPSRIVEIVQPHWFGHHPLVSSEYWGASMYGAVAAPFILSIYVGLAAVAATVTGLVLRDRRVIALTALTLLSLVAAIGDHTPLLRLIYATHLPVPIRFPERFVILGMFTMLVSGGIALDRITSDARARRVAMRVAIAMMAVYAIGAIASAHKQDWLLMSARAAALALILLLPERGGIGIALVAFTLADLLPLLHEFAPVKPRSYFERPAVANELRQPSNTYRIFFRPEWSAGPVTARYFANPAAAHDVIWSGMFPRLPAAWGFRTVFDRDIDQLNLTVSHELEHAMWTARDRGRRDWLEVFCAMANVEYVAALRPFPSNPPIAFVSTPQANPRYWLADEIVSGGDVLQRIVNERHSLRAAYVDKAAPAGRGAITRVDENTNDVTIDLVAEAPAFLVAANTYDEHWRATIDGHPAPLVRTNIAFQGVVVPAGNRRVRLEYRNGWVVAGVAITLGALAIAAILSKRTLHHRGTE